MSSAFPRPMRGKYMLVIDEIGDPGVHTPGDPFFLMTSAILEDHVLFGNIAKGYRKMFGVSELKARKTDPKDREKILSEISATGLKIHAAYVDKDARDNPHWWPMMKNRERAYRNTLSELMDETFSRTEFDDFTIVLDDNLAIRNGIGETIVTESAGRNCKNVVECYVENSERGVHRDILQTNDYIPREIRDRIRGKEGTARLDIEVKRLTNENIRR